ncbi:MAG TPA: hypothetical protein VHK90_10630 [Thermoanaerobaculia bacterium]|nr:hypothetical protein [Thermoanaerobaculia bacterium]
MPRTFAFSLFLLLVLPLTAQAAADIQLAELTTDKTSYVTGERIEVRMLIRNNGDQPAINVNATAYVDLSTMILAHAPADQWTCPPDRFPSCRRNQSLAAGGETELRLTILAPARVVASPMRVVGAAGSDSVGDPTNDNNRFAYFDLAPNARRANLSLRAVASANPVLPGEQTQIEIIAANAGPDEARFVRLELLTSVDPLTAEGWNCARNPSGVSVCTRPSLAPNSSASLTLRFTAPETEGVFTVWGRIQAETNFDETPNEQLDFRIAIGDPAEWQRFLIPITATQIPGANGSLWKTDVTMLFRGDGMPTVHPFPCGVPVTCIYPPPPLRRPFDGHVHGYVGISGITGGQFLHVRREYTSDVAINARFYDESRLMQTAGTELPIVRLEKFRTDTLSLLNIPVVPEYRQTLRIYDGDGRRTTVRIRAYVQDETTPRLDTTRELVVPFAEEPSVTPLNPAYFEIPLGQLLPLENNKLLRLEIEPVTEGSRIWAFVSMTNNETHHVTLVTP